MTTPTSTASTTPNGLLDGVDPAPLFTPYRLGSAHLPNRFVMAPMTRQFSPGGVPTAEVAAYYARRAAHVGLLITEGTYVGHLSAGGSDRVPRFYGDDALAGWSDVVAAVHAAGGRIAPQLWHLGATRAAGAPPHPDASVLSPSGIGVDGTTVGEPATQAEIDAVIAAFADAATAAKRIGFDAVELHGAHSYLLDQFLWDQTNRRTDGYGGSLANRTRLSAEVVAATRAAVGPDLPVIFRFSQWKIGAYEAQIVANAAELEQLLTPLVDAGVTALHVSTRRYWQPAFAGSQLSLAGWTKKLTGLPTIALGSVGVPQAFLDNSAETAPATLAPLLERFEAGEFDLVAIGRALLSEPEWPTKLRDGRLDEIRPFDKAHQAELF